MSSSATETLAEVTMPQMGVSVAEGTITEWRKRPGDWVENDEIIVEISTDKVETEVPSPATGRVKEILVEVGETVDVGVLLATIETEARAGEAHPDESAEGRGQRAEPSAPATPVSPVVRRIADEHDVELALVTGTGRRGRVTKKDLAGVHRGRRTETERRRRRPCTRNRRTGKSPSLRPLKPAKPAFCPPARARRSP